MFNASITLVLSKPPIFNLYLYLQAQEVAAKGGISTSCSLRAVPSWSRLWDKGHRMHDHVTPVDFPIVVGKPGLGLLEGSGTPALWIMLVLRKVQVLFKVTSPPRLRLGLGNLRPEGKARSWPTHVLRMEPGLLSRTQLAQPHQEVSVELWEWITENQNSAGSKQNFIFNRK